MCARTRRAPNSDRWRGQIDIYSPPQTDVSSFRTARIFIARRRVRMRLFICALRHSLSDTQIKFMDGILRPTRFHKRKMCHRVCLLFASQIYKEDVIAKRFQINWVQILHILWPSWVGFQQMIFFKQTKGIKNFSQYTFSSWEYFRERQCYVCFLLPNYFFRWIY